MPSTSDKFPQLKDTEGKRWWQFNAIIVNLTSVTINKNNLARELKCILVGENIQDYKKIRSYERIANEKATTKYINKNGVMEYCFSCWNRACSPLATIIQVLSELGLLPVNTSSGGYRLGIEPLEFIDNDDELEFPSHEFRTIVDLETKEIWVEGAKPCKLFGYQNGDQPIRDHVSAKNRRTIKDFDPIQISQAIQQNFSNDSEDIWETSNRPTIFYINEAGFWQLSMRSRKSAFKRFWKKMCETLSKKYSMVINSESKEVVALPKATPMDVEDPSSSMAFENLKLKLQLAEAEKSALALKSEKDLLALRAEKDMAMAKMQQKVESMEVESKLRVEIAEAKANEKAMAANFFFASNCNEALSTSYIEAAIDNHVNKERDEIIKHKLATKYQVTLNMEEVNPSKVGIFAFIWHRIENPSEYTAVRVNKSTFESKYRYVQLAENSSIQHREAGGKPPTNNQGKEVVIGSHFSFVNSRNAWEIFKKEKKELIFGLDFKNIAMATFSILDEPSLRAKYRQQKNFLNHHIELDNIFNNGRGEKNLAMNELQLYQELNFQSEDDCIQRCLVKDIWMLCQLMKEQHERNIDVCSEAQEEVNERTEEIKSQAEKRKSTAEQTFSNLGLSSLAAQQFARIEAIKLVAPHNELINSFSFEAMTARMSAETGRPAIEAAGPAQLAIETSAESAETNNRAGDGSSRVNDNARMGRYLFDMDM